MLPGKGQMLDALGLAALCSSMLTACIKPDAPASVVKSRMY